MTPDWRPSPNFGARKGGATPELIVLHYTAMESCDAACRTLCNPDNEVSAHYLIRKDGQVVHMVDERARAWHAGAGTWQGRGDVNSRSIGIELSNTGFTPFSAPLFDNLELLLRGIMTRWHIPAAGVIAHSDFAPGRKIDPGRRFDWQRLARQGLAIWPTPLEPADADLAQFTSAAIAFGYPDDVDPETVLASFRLRFNPTAEGPVTTRDVAMVKALAREFGIDRMAAGA
ncbi:N-acetylmuramoyl-L-alanine amidase [Litoreibacter halocynthiae]|uniref:N-acetylmuramoyl-L-alanine amidase n=1 Tax=Litoreibacter halocynthiae TaxID=1242689 RepID=A0A4R7LNR7_9RHOB|nr:N-acetylmuramoyl-L-alanine amidase [Litoreibacter halocynthiae]TDT77109.1 N-acetylmuramoyl-L-alanine amidase [Litoreibacter halocynthiae]